MVDIAARAMPTTPIRSSSDLEARLLRAGLDGTPIVETTGEDPWCLRHAMPMHRLLHVLDAAPAVGDLSDDRAALGKHRAGMSGHSVSRLHDVDLSVLETIIGCGLDALRSRHDVTAD